MPDRDKALFGFLAPGGQVLAAAFRDQEKACLVSGQFNFLERLACRRANPAVDTSAPTFDKLQYTADLDNC